MESGERGAVMMMLNEVLARLDRPQRSGAGYVARCPAHPDHNPSLSVRAGDGGRILLKCFRGCNYVQILAALRDAPAEHAKGLPASELKASANDKQRIEWARRIWREARDPRRTEAQDYLFGRGFTGAMPWEMDSRIDYQVRSQLRAGLAIPASLRFHRQLKHQSGACFPAMVAAIETNDGEIVGIHRTWLKPDGTGKAEVEPNKMALGREKGCAVHLSAGAPTLCVCEGIETGLSILQATGLHVWAALGTANLAVVELPGFVREIIIAADHDDAGMKAASAAAESYRDRGFQVRIASPRNRKEDWNDVLRR
jgi:putative DNA primase/helicase